MIEARIVADSLAPCGARLTTFVCTYPRFIHSEVMTHRAFSRNAASSRAIPVERMIKKIETEPAMPVHWGASQRGMQASGEVGQLERAKALAVWLGAARGAVSHARHLLELGLHKQVANRLLEPFVHMTTIISATDWENFFSLRAHGEAQPEFQELAFCAMAAHLESEPKELAAGQWHLPFADKYVDDIKGETALLKISTARCARVSYLNFEGDIAPEKDYALHDALAKSGHWSPFEHPAQAMAVGFRSGNFYGFSQYRKSFPNENLKLSREDMVARLAARRRA